MESPLTDAQIIARAEELAKRFGDSPPGLLDHPSTDYGLPPVAEAAERLLPPSQPTRVSRLPWLSGSPRPDTPPSTGGIATPPG